MHGLKHRRAILLTIIAAAAAGIVATIWVYYVQQAEKVRESAAIQIASVVKMRVGELAQWNRERMGDARFYQSNPDFVRLVRETLDQPVDKGPVTRLATWIQATQQSHKYHIVLLDAVGRIRFADNLDILPDAKTLSGALEGDKPRMLDFYRPGKGTSPRLAFIVPLIDNETPPRPLGAMLWIMDPADYIYPAIGDWPFQSESAETMLLRHADGFTTCLSPLRKAPGAPTVLRWSDDRRDTVFAQAGSGRSGLLYGTGLGDRQVVAVAHPVAGTPWTLLACMDREEIEAPLDHRLRELLLTSLALLAAVVAVTAYVWRSQHASLLLERLENAEGLRNAERRFRLFFNSSPDAIFLVENPGAGRPPGLFVEVNDVACQLLGYTREELLRLGPLNVDSPASLKDIPPNIERLIAEGRHTWEGEMVGKDGRLIPLEIHTRTVELDGRSLWMAQARDISERKLTRRQLARLNRTLAVSNGINQAILRERNLDMLLNQACEIAITRGNLAMAWIGLLTEDGSEIIPRAQAGRTGSYLRGVRILLAEPEETAGPASRSVRNASPTVHNDITPHASSPWARRAIEHGYRSCASFPLVLRGKPRGMIALYSDDPGFFAEDEVNLMLDVAANLSMALELSEHEAARLAAERALRTSERRFRTILENMPGIAVQGYDRDKRIIFWNQASASLYGWSAEEAIGRRPHELFLPDDLSRKLYRAIDRWFEGGKPLAPGEFNVRRKDGAELNVFSGFFLFKNTEGTPEIFSLDIDFTSRNAAQAELRLLHAALEATPSAWVITNAEGVIQWVNPAFSSLTGYAADEVLGKTPHLLYSGHHSAEFYSNLWDTIRSGRIWSGELLNRRRDGSLYHEHMTVAPVRDQQGIITHFVAMKQNITEHKRLEHQLLRAQRMEGIGLLAGGIAHDLNNVLAPILLSVELLRMRFPGPENKSTLDIIESSARRGAGVVRQVLTFARGIEGDRVSLRPKDLIREIAFIAEETFPRAITVSREVENDLPCVLGDATQLHQVLLNLAVNARDAMPNGGTLALSAGEVDVAKTDSHYMGEVRPGRYVRLSVRDTGMGIPTDNLERIFEPFFTTKGVGQGTGLGLSAVFGIVRSHGGFIEVESTVGKGSCFQIYLPSLPREKSAAPFQPGAGVIRGEGRSLLVCDDEEAIRLISGGVLTKAGFTVYTAADGDEARRLYSQYKDKIRLALLDIMMPGETGDQIAASLRRQSPGLPILFSTGMVGDANVEHILKEQLRTPHTAMLAKPYDELTLLSSVARLLDQPHHSPRTT